MKVAYFKTLQNDLTYMKCFYRLDIWTLFLL